VSPRPPAEKTPELGDPPAPFTDVEKMHAEQRALADERNAKHAAAVAAITPLRAWHASSHRSRVLTAEEGKLLEYGDAPQLGVRPNARMTIATRAFWSMPAERRNTLLEAAPAELDNEGRELFALKTLYEAIEDVPENIPTDLVACNAGVENLLARVARVLDAPAKA
jgi:hypothetical protein